MTEKAAKNAAFFAFVSDCISVREKLIAIFLYFFSYKVYRIRKKRYICSVIKNNNPLNKADGLKNGKIMKQIFSVRYTRPTVESNEIFASENEQEARAFFEDEKKKLSANEPVDISGWTEYDTAWPQVYCVELCRITVDEEDGYVEDMETLDETNLYWFS